MYGQSSLRIQHLNYFNHVLELFKPYLSKDFKLKTYSFVDKRTNNSYSSVNFAATQKDYHCLVLIITEIYFIIQII